MSFGLAGDDATATRRTRWATGCRCRIRRTTPLTYTACTLSAPATCNTICVPFHARGADERGAVHTGRDALGQRRRRARERHLHVGVVRMVTGVLHRPAAGHRDRSSPGSSPVIAVSGTASGWSNNSNDHVAVERTAIARLDRHVHGQPADPGDGRIGPRSEMSDDWQHQWSRRPGTQPLLAPRVRPLMNCRCNARYTASVGRR